METAGRELNGIHCYTVLDVMFSDRLTVYLMVCFVYLGENCHNLSTKMFCNGCIEGLGTGCSSHL